MIGKYNILDGPLHSQHYTTDVDKLLADNDCVMLPDVKDHNISFSEDMKYVNNLRIPNIQLDEENGKMFVNIYHRYRYDESKKGLVCEGTDKVLNKGFAHSIRNEKDGNMIEISVSL